MLILNTDGLTSAFVIALWQYNEESIWGFCECVRRNVGESQILHLQPKVTSDIIIKVRCNSRVENFMRLGSSLEFK